MPCPRAPAAQHPGKAGGVPWGPPRCPARGGEDIPRSRSFFTLYCVKINSQPMFQQENERKQGGRGTARFPGHGGRGGRGGRAARVEMFGCGRQTGNTRGTPTPGARGGRSGRTGSEGVPGGRPPGCALIPPTATHTHGAAGCPLHAPSRGQRAAPPPGSRGGPLPSRGPGGPPLCLARWPQTSPLPAAHETPRGPRAGGKGVLAVLEKGGGVCKRKRGERTKHHSGERASRPGWAEPGRRVRAGAGE